MAENDLDKPIQLYRFTDDERDELVKCVAFAKQYHVSADESLLIRVANNLGHPFKESQIPAGSITSDRPPTEPTPLPQKVDTPAQPPTVQDALAQARFENVLTSVKQNLEKELTKAEIQETKDALSRVLTNLNVVL